MIMTHHVQHIFMPINQTINWICMQCNILLNEHNSLPQSIFAKNNQMRSVLLLKANSIPFMVGPVHILVKN